MCRSPRGALARRWRRTFGSLIVPSRSILGARLRNRVPQYGHSVMYGDTSAPQFLQTTKRSGPDAMGCVRFYVAAKRPRALGGGGLDDLRHDLAEIVVGLVDDDLALGAAAAFQEVLDTRQIVGRAHLLGVLADAVEQAPREVLRGDPPPLGQVDELARQPVARGQPLVLVEDLPLVVGQLLAGLEARGQLVDHRLDERGERHRVLDARLGVADADLDRAELGVRPDVVPEVGVV